MSTLVSITSQGQVTIPSAARKLLGIEGATKASLEIIDNTLVIRPQADFWSVVNSMSGDIELTDTQLREARDSFSKEWARDPRV